MLPLCFNTNALRQFGLARAFSEIAYAGYAGAEISLHASHYHPTTADESALESLASVIAESGLIVPCLAAGAPDLLGSVPYEPSLVSVEGEDRDRRVAFIQTCLRLAERLRIPVVNVGSGFLAPGADAGRARRALVDGIKRCLEGSSGGVTLAIEPEPGMFIETTDQAIEVIEAVDCPAFRMNPDIGHIRTTESDFLQALRAALPYAVHCHIEDIRDRVHHHLIPGDGDIPFEAVFDVVEDAGFSGWVSVELYSQTDRWEDALGRSIALLSAAWLLARQRAEVEG
jgi:hydroxypyruvate isomerase